MLPETFLLRSDPSNFLKGVKMDYDKYLQYSWEQILCVFGLLCSFKRRPSGAIVRCCVFHDDDNPSLHFYTDSKRFHCYGCGAEGNIIDFVLFHKSLRLWSLEDFFKHYVLGSPGLGVVHESQLQLFPLLSVGQFCFWEPAKQRYLLKVTEVDLEQNDIPF